MSDLLVAVVSITPTQRGRYFWAAWWTAPPSRIPFRRPDASNGGAATRDEALREAERVAGVMLSDVDPRWARAWIRIIRGQPPFTERDARALGAASQEHFSSGHRAAPDRSPPRPKNAPPASIWTILGVAPDASLIEIKRAFRQRALETHPDRGGDSDAFRAAHAAYETAIERRAKTIRRPKKKS